MQSNRYELRLAFCASRSLARAAGVGNVPTHFKSGGECVRMEAAERRRAADHGFHEPKEIRGLKICHNPECPSAPVNRDHNAALNIYTNGLLLLHGYEPIRKHVGDEVEILRLENEMTGA
jgi:hypothetical protein